MATNSVEATLAGAKNALANANKFTQSVTGNSTDAFAPKKPTAPKIPQSHKEAPYSVAHQARETGEGIKARMENENTGLKTLE
jgi:hypothetical protein